MAVEAKRLSVWDTLRVQWYVSVPAFLLGLVVPNRRLFSFVARRGGGARAMRFLRELRDKYACDHLWLWFPGGRTLMVLASETIDDVLASEANSADPALKKRALSRFVPDGVIISSGEAWRDRRAFNVEALDLDNVHRHAGAFSNIAVAEAQRLTSECSTLRWADFQSLGERVSHQVILGDGAIDPAAASELAAMLPWSNVLLRNSRAFAAFYERIRRNLRGDVAVGPPACLMHDSMRLLESGTASESTRVPSQIAFWFFVLKDAIELHIARTLALIATHPQVQARVRDEIDGAGAVGVHTIERLRYLDACIMEQLRLWTPVPLLLRRTIAPMTLRGGIAVDEGKQIMIPAAFHHRDARFFGGRADRFAPDAVGDGDHSPTYVFSAHRQRCAGRSLVMHVLKATLASLLERHRFDLVAPAIDCDRIPYLFPHFDIELRATPTP